MGFTLLYLALVVLHPAVDHRLKSAALTWAKFWATVTAPRTLAAYRLSFGAALAAALDQRRLRPARRLGARALLASRASAWSTPWSTCPFALPTAVAGIALASVYAANGWVGRYLEPLGIHVAYTPLGVVVALTFIGLPFVVRTVQPVLRGARRRESRRRPRRLGAGRARRPSGG